MIRLLAAVFFWEVLGIAYTQNIPEGWSHLPRKVLLLALPLMLDMRYSE